MAKGVPKRPIIAPKLTENYENIYKYLLYKFLHILRLRDFVFSLTPAQKMDAPRNAQILRDSPFLQAIIAGYIRPLFLLLPPL